MRKMCFQFGFDAVLYGLKCILSTEVGRRMQRVEGVSKKFKTVVLEIEGVNQNAVEEAVRGSRLL